MMRLDDQSVNYIMGREDMIEAARYFTNRAFNKGLVAGVACTLVAGYGYKKFMEAKEEADKDIIKEN